MRNVSLPMLSEISFTRDKKYPTVQGKHDEKQVLHSEAMEENIDVLI